MITYINNISVEDYNILRGAVGWRLVNPKQAEIGLKNSAFIITAMDNDKPIGSARYITDGGYHALIIDVMILPEYQGKGIGRVMLENIMQHIKDSMEEGDCIHVCLMAASGKEDFYRKFGFDKRPTLDLGAGMSQWVEKK